tara:strand:- start:217 stop:762 length:546 start_codon:yes stop_codon:yes gene_type:complete
MDKMNFRMLLTYEKKACDISKDFLIPRTISKQTGINQLNQLNKIPENQVVIMGKSTLNELKKPLENRINIIFTSNPDEYSLKKLMMNTSNFYAVKDFEQLEQVMYKINTTDATIIGGIKIFNLFLPYITRIYGKCLFKNKVSNIDSHFGNIVKTNFEIRDVSDFKYDKEQYSLYKDVLFTK